MRNDEFLKKIGGKLIEYSTKMLWNPRRFFCYRVCWNKLCTHPLPPPVCNRVKDFFGGKQGQRRSEGGATAIRLGGCLRPRLVGVADGYPPSQLPVSVARAAYSRTDQKATPRVHLNSLREGGANAPIPHSYSTYLCSHQKRGPPKNQAGKYTYANPRFWTPGKRCAII